MILETLQVNNSSFHWEGYKIESPKYNFLSNCSEIRLLEIVGEQRIGMGII